MKQKEIDRPNKSYPEAVYICGANLNGLLAGKKDRYANVYFPNPDRHPAEKIQRTLEDLDEQLEKNGSARIELAHLSARSLADPQETELAHAMQDLGIPLETWDEIYAKYRSLYAAKRGKYGDWSEDGVYHQATKELIIALCAYVKDSGRPIVLSEHRKNTSRLDVGMLLPFTTGEVADTFLRLDWVVTNDGVSDEMPPHLSVYLEIVAHDAMNASDSTLIDEDDISPLEAQHMRVKRSRGELHSYSANRLPSSYTGKDLLDGHERDVDLALAADIAYEMIAQKPRYRPVTEQVLGKLTLADREEIEEFQKIIENVKQDGAERKCQKLENIEKLRADIKQREDVFNDVFQRRYEKDEIPEHILNILGGPAYKPAVWTEKLLGLSDEDLIKVINWNKAVLIEDNMAESPVMDEVRVTMKEVIRQMFDMGLHYKLTDFERIVMKHKLLIGDKTHRGNSDIGGYNNARFNDIVSFYQFGEIEDEDIKKIVTHEFGHSLGRLPYRFENEAAVEAFAKLCDGEGSVAQRLGDIFGEEELDGIYDWETIVLRLVLTRGKDMIHPEVVFREYFGNDRDYTKAVIESYGFDMRKAIAYVEYTFKRLAAAKTSDVPGGSDIDASKEAMKYVVRQITKDPKLMEINAIMYDRTFNY